MTAPLRTNYPMRGIGRQMDTEGVKRRAFADQGVVVVSVNDARLDDWERQMLKNVGMKLFGPRRQ